MPGPTLPSSTDPLSADTPAHLPVSPMSLLAVGVAGVGAVAGVLADVGVGARLALVGLGVACGLGLTLWESRRRRAALLRLEQEAATTLAVDLPRRGESARALALPGLLPGELRPLGVAMLGLGQRIRVQLKEVAKHSRNLEALIDALDEPLIATGHDDRVILCSKSAEALLSGPMLAAADASPESPRLIGRPINELFTQQEILDLHAQAKNGQVRRGRVRLTTALGKRTYQFSASPLPAAWGDGVFGAVLTLRDVTELDQAVQVKTDFVANASHELRTPVSAIRGAAETLQSTGDDPGMSERLRSMILSHALRLEEMLRDLLDLSRLESPEIPLVTERIDLQDLQRVLRQLSEHACMERDLTLSFEFDEELAGLCTDRRLLTLIVRNLVENATKFAYEHTTIRVLASIIEAEVEPAGSDTLTVPAAQSTSDTSPSPHQRGAGSAAAATANNITNPTPRPQPVTVRFEVIDQGMGIPLQHQERVFERYYQVDQARTGLPGWRRGTGLGLAIVKHAAKALHGRCGLKSVWGQGTTVWVEIKAELAPAPQAATGRQAG